MNRDSNDLIYSLSSAPVLTSDVNLFLNHHFSKTENFSQQLTCHVTQISKPQWTTINYKMKKMHLFLNNYIL